MTRVPQLLTLKVTTGSPDLARDLQQAMHKMLRAMETTSKDAGYKRACMVAATKIRIVPGER